MRLVTYIRVSTEGQVDGYGLDAQRADVTRWAEAHGHDIVAECVDPGVSGALPAADRPGLTCALETIAADADGLLVARLDRLARELTVQEAILATIWRDDAVVFTSDGGEVLRDDPEDPMRTAMRQMAGVFAQLERAWIVKRMRDGRRAKKLTGGHPGGFFPFGLGKDGPVEREQAVLALIRSLRAQGSTWEQVAEFLNAGGAEYAPRTATRWTPRNAAKVAS